MIWDKDRKCSVSPSSLLQRKDLTGSFGIVPFQGPEVHITGQLSVSTIYHVECIRESIRSKIKHHDCWARNSTSLYFRQYRGAGVDSDLGMSLLQSL